MLDFSEIRDFIEQNRHRRVEELALLLTKRSEEERIFILRQIEGWQRLREKVPVWARQPDLIYPPRLALEQCSGEAAARYKAQVVRRLLKEKTSVLSEKNTSMADLTGGMGVDFSFIAPLFSRATYIEQRPELVAAARNNFPLLGLEDAVCVEGDGMAHLRSMERVDLLFLDPARRDVSGRKTVLLEDCEPNVLEHLPLLLEQSRILMLKLSTMLDLRQAIDQLGCVAEAHVFAANGECKDLLLVCCAEHQGETTLYCANESGFFAFTAAEEATASCPMAESIEGFLYEPDAAVMKAGAYRTIGTRFGLQKLHANTHLYISDKVCDGFPGRIFKIVRTWGFSKKELREVSALEKANLTVRNFPATVAELRKKLKLREGGKDYLFACTSKSNEKILVCCEKVFENNHSFL